MVGPGQGCDRELGRVVSNQGLGLAGLECAGQGRLWGRYEGARAGIDMCLGCTPEFGTPTRGLAVLVEAT